MKALNHAIFQKTYLKKTDPIIQNKKALPLGKPWINSIIDVYTGYPLAFSIFIQNNWVAHGLPEVLEVDRGKEFSSEHLAQACKQLQIELVHSTANKTWYSGAVERNFRKLNQILLSRKNGSSFSNLSDKEESGPVNHAVISYSELLKSFHNWVVDDYAVVFNEAVNGVPVKLWVSSVKNTPNSRVPSSNFDVKVALMRSERGRITLTGIRFKYLYYQSEKLIHLLNRINAKGRVNSVEFKYDPTDMSKIFVYDPIDYSYFEVLCTDQEYTNGLNEYVHQVTVNRLREEMKNIDKEALLSAKNKLEQVIEDELLIAKRRKAIRMEGQGSNIVGTAQKKAVTESKSSSTFTLKSE